MSTRHSVFSWIIFWSVIVLLALLPAGVEAQGPTWRGEYFTNPHLIGAPALVREDTGINFNWSTGAPAARIPADNFSVRWTRDSYFGAGRYRFTTETDDGVRLYLDGRLLINRWQPMSRMQYAVDVDVPGGVHTVRMEYFDVTKYAVARLRWVPVGRPSPSDMWRGEYYTNRNLAGGPTLVRMDRNVDFNWGTGAPAAGLPADNFSVRWTRDASFDAGRYRFTCENDDGIRLFVDGTIIMDEWHPMVATRHAHDVDLDAGMHTIRLEYFEQTGGALARMWWERIGAPAIGADDWRGEYFDNRHLSGSPEVVRGDKDINFNWGTGSPDDDISDDNFSVRWTRTHNFVPGVYEFRTESDDGVRLWVDGQLLIDEWREVSGTHKKEIHLSEGAHTVKMEYFERHGNARAKLRWTGPCLAADSGNLITHVPPYPSYSWIKVYRRDPGTGQWLDMNPKGYASLNEDGLLKIDGLPVAVSCYGEAGHPYWVEQYVDGKLTRSIGNTDRGEPAFRIKAGEDNFTPW